MHGALVVERPGRRLVRITPPPPTRSSRPTSGASVSSSAGAAEIRSVSAAAVAGIDAFDGMRQPRLEAAPDLSTSSACRNRRRRSGREDATEAAAAADDPRRTSRSGAPDRRACLRLSEPRLRKKIRCSSAQDRDRGVIGRHVHQQPVARRRGGRAGQHRVDDVEGRRVDDAGVRAGCAHTSSYSSMMSRRATMTTNSWPSARAHPGVS